MINIKLDWLASKMWRLILCVMWCSSVSVKCSQDAGPGLWNVQSIENCEEAEHKLKVELEQTKINRTHDGWNGRFNFEETFTQGLSIQIEISQLVDGGYRLINKIDEPELIDYLNKCAEKNVRLALEAAGVDPPEFPIEAGEYEMQEFVFDYSELTRKAFYGEYSGKLHVKNGMDEVFCIMAYVEFVEDE